MTKIQPGRPVIRLTDSFCAHFPIVIELHPKHLNLRLKGEREGHPFTYERLISSAWRIELAVKIHPRRLHPSRRRSA